MKDYALTNRFCRLALTLMLLVGLTLGAQPVAPAQATPVLEQANAPRNVTWTGAGNDGRWRNPANWAGQHAPGARDRVRLTGAQAVWFDAASPIAGLTLDANFSGVLYLARPLDVTGELVIAGGQLAQGAQPIRVAALTQTGGEIVGGAAPFTVAGAAQVQAGLWTTCGDLTKLRSLDIALGATVRLGANGNLILTGDGSPLTGDGLLDMMTHRPNGVEFTGSTTQDLMLAGPSHQLRAAGLDQQNYDPARTNPAALASVGAEEELLSAVLDAANGFAYFGTQTYPGFVVKVDVNPAHPFARVGAVTLDAGVGYRLSSAVLDAANGYAYFGGDGSVVKVDVNPAHAFARVSAVTLNAGEVDLTSAVLDAANGYAYFGINYSYPTPSKVVKVDVNPAHALARVDAITLNEGESYLSSAVLDAANGYAYFGGGLWPGIVVKVDVNPSHPFTRTAGIVLNAGEDEIHSAVLDAANGYAYFGTYYTSPGIVVKVDVNPASTFARVGAVTLNAGEENLTSAALDMMNGYAYFGTEWTSPGSVVKVDVNPAHTFARVDAVTLNVGEVNLTSAVLDAVNGFAYFGTYFTTPGRVVKLDVNPAHTFTRTDGITLNAGETPLPAAFDAIEDTYVSQGAPANNYGNSDTLWIGAGIRDLIKFDLAAIPAGTHVSQATLHIDYHMNSHTGPAGTPTFTITAHRSSATWSELVVTWNSQPSYAEAHGVTSFSSFGWKSMDVTNLAQAWVNGTYPNHGVMLLGVASLDNYLAGLCPRAGGSWTCSDTYGAPYLSVSYAYIISGNAGVAGATLSYNDGGTKTATADGTGNYTITVPAGWSGVVTPSKIGYTFSPTSRAYTVLADQTAQDYIATATTYTLAVNTAGTGTGSVAKTPDTFNYAAGTVVTLTASPTLTSTFGGWSGAMVTMANPLVLTMDSNKGVTATFTRSNQPPAANAGTDQTIEIASLVRLNGSGSFDPDGNLPLAYGWTQTGGAAVTFSPTVSRTAFTAPKAADVLTFTLTVTDTGALTDTDEVVVTVKELIKVYLPLVLRVTP